MEMMNRAIEDAADFRGMMGKIEARAAHEANMLRMQAAMQGGSELAAERRYVVLDRQPGENAKVSGGGTPSAALPGYAGDNNNNGET